MPNLGDIFVGSAMQSTRDYLGIEMLRSGRSVVYMPCVGRFWVAQTYLGHGGKAERVFASDIGLFPAVVGNLADPGKDLARLNLEFKDSVPEPNRDDEMDLGATALLAIKLAQLTQNPPNPYLENIKREILTRWDVHKEKVLVRLVKMVQKLDGIHYAVEDMWSVLKRAARDENGVLFLDTPTAASGHRKMSAQGYVTWSQPDADLFQPDDRARLFDVLEGAKCYALVTLGGDTKGLPEEGWRRVVAVPQKMVRQKDGGVVSQADIVVTNMEQPKAVAMAKLREFGPPPFPVYCDEPITRDSQLVVKEIHPVHAEYYRDLFVHKLGPTNTDGLCCYAALVDGRVFGVFGLGLDDLYSNRQIRESRMDGKEQRFVSARHASEIFGVVKTSETQPRLKRLLILASSSGDFAPMLRSKGTQINVTLCEGIKTTSYTKGMTEQARRGISYVVERAELPQGFKLNFRTDFRDDTFAEVLTRWLDEQDNAKREKEKRRGRKRTRSRSRA